MALIQLRGIEPQLIKTTVNHCFLNVKIMLKFIFLFVCIKINTIFTL